jgi:hypothetical protein
LADLLENLFAVTADAAIVITGRQLVEKVGRQLIIGDMEPVNLPILGIEK